MSARVAFALCLLLAGVAWVGPSSAYRALTGGRAVTANIVAEGSGYSAPIVSACTSGITGVTCRITIFNNATSAQTYTVTLQSDTGGAVKSTWSVDGTTQSGGSATGASKNPGSTSVVTIPMNACTLGCTTKNTYWMIQGSNSGILSSREERVLLAVLNA